jgi:hypothetical protein
MTAGRLLSGLAAAGLALLSGLGFVLATPVAARGGQVQAHTTAPAQNTARETPPVTIALDRREVAIGVGDRFNLTSTIANESAEPLTGLIAHIDILSTDPKRYVDPEDWSPRRTVFLEALEPGGTTRPVWEVQAVDSGPLLVWVTVSRPGSEGVAVSAPLHLTVAQHVDVNAGGVLPIVVGVPLVISALLAATAWSRRRAVRA